MSEKHKDKFCLYHNAAGHTTAICFDLKDEIEYLIRRGKLTGYRKEANPRERNPPNREIEGAIKTIAGGPYPGGRSQRSMKDYAREVWQGPSRGVFQVSRQSPQPPRRTTNHLTFTDANAEGVRFPYHDPLVLSAVIGNHLFHRCLIDDGSSVDILYLDVLEKMSINPQSLRAAASP